MREDRQVSWGCGCSIPSRFNRGVDWGFLAPGTHAAPWALQAKPDAPEFHRQHPHHYQGNQHQHTPFPISSMGDNINYSEAAKKLNKTPPRAWARGGILPPFGASHQYREQGLTRMLPGC